MAWCKFDDKTHAELAHLSHTAFRLYIAGVSYSRDRQLGGLFAPRDLDTLAREQRISVKDLEAALPELLDNTYDKPLWLREGDCYLYRSIDKHNPPTSTERVRRHRADPTQREALQGVARNGDETFHAVSGNADGTLGNASSRARPRAGYPEPVPVPVPIPSVTASAVPLDGAPKVDPFDFTSVLPLPRWQQVYTDAAREAGKSDFETVAQLGDVEATAGEAINGGVEDGVVEEAVRRCAANPRGVVRKLHIEIARIRQERAAPKPNPVSEALRAAPKASELLAQRDARAWA